MCISIGMPWCVFVPEPLPLSTRTTLEATDSAAAADGPGSDEGVLGSGGGGGSVAGGGGGGGGGPSASMLKPSTMG